MWTFGEFILVRLVNAWFIALLATSPVYGESSTQQVSLKTIGTNTYYVDGHIEGSGDSSFLVDTGSGYSTISESTLVQLKQNGNAIYVKKLEGVLANGATMIVPVYRITSVVLADKCVVRDVEVAVFPAGTRQILGLSALSKLMPFTFDLNPPSLTLSNCTGIQAGVDPAHEKTEIPSTGLVAVDSPV